MASTSSRFDLVSGLKRFFSRKRSSDPENCSFGHRQEEELAFEAVQRGTTMVPLEQIVGSVGRYRDFDRQFRTSSAAGDERLQGIKAAMEAGKRMPPIALYQIKEDYFILDGHHRFRAARELGSSEIRSQIVELLPSRDTLENQLYVEKTNFRDKTGLSQGLDLTEPGQTSHLDWQIQEHQKFLSLERDSDVSYQQAAADWYLTIYRPLATIIGNSNLVEKFEERTVDDLYLYISVHQWEEGKKRRYGIGIDRLIPKDMEEFRTKMARHRAQEYPDMRREVNVFILLNVEGKYQQQIFDKLLALDEVREVHVVYGNIDMIAKITLMRDLLSSDAELLSHFIQSTIRQWRGVNSTQTLIPGMSRVKDRDRCLL